MTTLTPCPKCRGPRVAGGCLATAYPCCRRCDLGAGTVAEEKTEWTAYTEISVTDYMQEILEGKDRLPSEWTFYLWSANNRTPETGHRYQVEGVFVASRLGLVTVPAGTRVRRVQEEEWCYAWVGDWWLKDHTVGNRILQRDFGTGRGWLVNRDTNWSPAPTDVRIRIRKADVMRSDDNDFTLHPDRDTYFERLP